jgi:hypothetical protein
MPNDAKEAFSKGLLLAKRSRLGRVSFSFSVREAMQRSIAAIAAALTSGLDVDHEIATVQTTAIDNEAGLIGVNIDPLVIALKLWRQSRLSTITRTFTKHLRSSPEFPSCRAGFSERAVRCHSALSTTDCYARARTRMIRADVGFAFQQMRRGAWRNVCENDALCQTGNLDRRAASGGQPRSIGLSSFRPRSESSAMPSSSRREECQATAATASCCDSSRPCNDDVDGLTRTASSAKA